jgi:hypothetical protein
MDRLLDLARTGPLHLRQPEIANMVVDAVRHGKSRSSTLAQSLKRFTA